MWNSFVLWIAISVLLLYLAKKLIERQKLRRIIEKIPGSRTYPLIGTVYLFLNVPREKRWRWLMEYSKQFEDGIYRTWLGETPRVHISKAKYLDTILASTDLIGKPVEYDALSSWLGTGLVTSAGEKWQRHRKLITPTFHFNILQEFFKIMSEKAEILNRCIEANVAKNPGKPMDIRAMLGKTALDIICESAMGIRSNSQLHGDTKYSDALNNLPGLFLERLLRPWLYFDWMYHRTAHGKTLKRLIKIAHDFTDQVIRERKRERERRRIRHQDTISEEPKRKAFLDHLMDVCEEEGARMTDDDLRAEVDTFTFAGHDTTSLAMSFALFCIGNDPKVQEKLNEELNDVFGETRKAATYQDISQLKYLERVIKETLRLYPSAPAIGRLVKKPLVIGGYQIPPGTTLAVQIHQIHRDPENWSDPDKFDPDRFLPENSRGRHPYAYIPFSAGPRNCVGQKFAMLEAKTILAAVLRKWKVTSQLAEDELVIYNEVLLNPVNGVNLFFAPKYQF